MSYVLSMDGSNLGTMKDFEFSCEPINTQILNMSGYSQTVNLGQHKSLSGSLFPTSGMLLLLKDSVLFSNQYGFEIISVEQFLKYVFRGFFVNLELHHIHENSVMMDFIIKLTSDFAMEGVEGNANLEKVIMEKIKGRKIIL